MYSHTHILRSASACHQTEITFMGEATTNAKSNLLSSSVPAPGLVCKPLFCLGNRRPLIMWLKTNYFHFLSISGGEFTSSSCLKLPLSGKTKFGYPLHQPPPPHLPPCDKYLVWWWFGRGAVKETFWYIEMLVGCEI